MALRRRLEGVATIEISQRAQTAAVQFGPEEHAFSPQAFRAAFKDAQLEIVTLEMHACGVVDEAGDRRWLLAAETRLLVVGDQFSFPGRVCVTGRFHDEGDAARIDVVELRAANP